MGMKMVVIIIALIGARYLDHLSKFIDPDIPRRNMRSLLPAACLCRRKRCERRLLLSCDRKRERKKKRSLHNPFWKLKTKNLDNIPKFRVVVVVEDIPERDTNDDERPVSTLNLDK